MKRTNTAKWVESAQRGMRRGLMIYSLASAEKVHTKSTHLQKIKPWLFPEWKWPGLYNYFLVICFTI